LVYWPDFMVFDILLEAISFVLGVVVAVWLAEYVDYRQQRGKKFKKNVFAWSLSVWFSFLRAGLAAGRLHRRHQGCPGEEDNDE
jgi:hypothetical protein